MTDPTDPLVSPELVPPDPGGEARVLPMFPLGTVLVPGAPLPLHVFEPRYQALVQDCLAADGEFGVVLITRGSEVGGGDLRAEVGTVAGIVEAASMAGGRWALGCAGLRRIRVLGWLDDDPYPRAEVVDWPDEAPGPEVDLPAALERVRVQLRHVLAQLAELGVRAAPATLELPDDPVLASYAAVAVGPFGPFDAYSLLTEPGPASRLARTERLLAEEGEVLAQRLALGDEDDEDDEAPPTAG